MLSCVLLLPTQGDTVVITPSFVVSGSVSVLGYTDSADYSIYQNKLVWLATTPSDSIRVFYREIKFEVAYDRKSPDIIQPTYRQNPFTYVPTKSESQSTYGSLNTAGNISRGIGFGNAQDVVVNSNLNLRISGLVAQDVEVLAVISDENNPIQPEGNTQQIQDFDQVYITLKKNKAQLTMGDFLMKKPSDSYFINYYKKSRGLQFQNEQTVKGWELNTQAEVAMSRGRFSRNRIDGIEGNSGPYRLSGDNGEKFIIVIAGTENVYLDGGKLTRGQDNDYIINYNTGEITFTPRVLITRYSRIVVEFQYSDRNYGRSVAHIGASASKGALTVYVNGFNEMDLKSQPTSTIINTIDSTTGIAGRDVLALSGDEVGLYPTAREKEVYDPDLIMYTRSTIGANQVYVYAPKPQEGSTYYSVRFSNIGQGQGDYVQAQTAANGKVFEYIGQGLGNYSPVEVLIPPKRLNTMNIGLVLEKDGKKSGIEYAISSLDKNTFSHLDDSDNGGFGLKLFRQTEKTLSKEKKTKWSSDVSYEMVSGQYNYVERYRNVEFDRKWNKVLSNPSSLASLIPKYEHIANGAFRLEKGKEHFIENTSALFVRPGSFSGYSNLTKGQTEWEKIQLYTNLELMQSTTEQDSTALENQFYSIVAGVRRPFGDMMANLSFMQENSAFVLDTLQAQSYGFTKYSASLRGPVNGKFKYNFTANQRTDRQPQNGGFSTSTNGRDVGVNATYKSKSGQHLAISTIYRELEIVDTLLSSQDVENTIQSRMELNLHAFKKFIQSRTFYEIGTGQEQRREFQYLKVQPGNGVYIWNDYDSNTLKTINEFELASALDAERADYIKIYTPVAGFITTNTNKISETFTINPMALYKGEKEARKPFYTRFYSISTLLLDRKVLPTNLWQFIALGQESLQDTMLINTNQNVRSTLFFNRGNPKYSVDYTYVSNESKQLLTNGFDSRSAQENIMNVRVNLGGQFTLNTRMSEGKKLYASQFFTQNDFNYTFYEVEPKLQILFKKIYRIELKSKYYTAANQAQYGGESSESLALGAAFKYAKANKGTFDFDGNYIRVNYDGSVSSNLGYELLRGLQDGDNLTWRFGYQRTLQNNVQLVVSYNGRKSEETPIIHIGRLVARYLF